MSSNTKNNAICAAINFQLGNGTECVARPKYSARGWNPQIYASDQHTTDKAGEEKGLT